MSEVACLPIHPGRSLSRLHEEGTMASLYFCGNVEKVRQNRATKTALVAELDYP
jgi:hypothetical protein